MHDKVYNREISIGRGTFIYPEYIEGVTVQCKNCSWHGSSNHCGVMPSERLTPESWCATSSPKQFFTLKG